MNNAQTEVAAVQAICQSAIPADKQQLTVHLDSNLGGGKRLRIFGINRLTPDNLEKFNCLVPVVNSMCSWFGPDRVENVRKELYQLTWELPLSTSDATYLVVMSYLKRLYGVQVVDGFEV